MKIKHIFLSLVAACAFSMPALSQTARQILDKTAGKLKSCGGIEATFEGTQFKGTHETGSTTGHIQLSGAKFKLTSHGVTTWFDGRTQWTLMTGSDEVNISTPTAAELQQMNPYTFLNLYKKGYLLKLAPFTYKGKSCHEVRMTAQHAKENIQLVIAVIDKQTLMPLSIRIKDNRGEWIRIRLDSLKTGRHWKDDNFRFNEKEHPGIEVIDLR